jgi:hypothetical protein
MEFIKSGEEFEGSILINKRSKIFKHWVTIENFLKEIKQSAEIFRNKEDERFKESMELTDEFYADKNKGWIKGIKGIKAEPIIMKYYNKKFENLSDNSFYIKIGKHAGGYVKKIKKDKKFKTSIWLSSDGEPLGWAQITFLTKEEAEALKKERQEFIIAQKKETEGRIKRNEEAKKSAMEKKRLKEEKLASMSDQAKMIYAFQHERDPGQIEPKEYEIYSFLLDDKVDEADKIKAAKALKDYYEQEGIWDKKMKKSNKRRGRINKVKEILKIEA